MTAKDEPQRFRVAYLGPAPGPEGGMASTVSGFIGGLVAAGADVEAFLSGRIDEAGRALLDPAVRVHEIPSRWEWDRWYSSHSTTAFLSGLVARRRSGRRIVDAISDRHALARFDCVFQLSGLDGARVRAQSRSLPPVVTLPGTHARGELRALWQERHVAWACGRLRFALLANVLVFRSIVQRREAQSRAGIVALSEHYAAELQQDVGVPPSRVRVVPNPVDVAAFTPEHRVEATPAIVAFIGRVAARKGIDSIVELSHRLHDLAGDVEIVVAGGHSQTSDYRRLLLTLNSEVARVAGMIDQSEVIDLLRRARVAVVPSTFEPFGLTAAEAVLCGTRLVATSVVGAIEHLAGPGVTVIEPRDEDSLEDAVRSAVAAGALSVSESSDLHQRAARLFEPAAVGRKLLGALQDAAEATRTDLRAPILVLGAVPRDPSGVVDHTRQLMGHWAGAGHPITDALTTVDPPTARVALRASMELLTQAARVKRGQRAFVPYSVFTYSWRGVPGPGVLVPIVARLRGARVITFAHEFAVELSDRHGLTRGIPQRIAAVLVFVGSHRVIVSTEERRRQVRRLVPWSQVDVSAIPATIPVAGVTVDREPGLIVALGHSWEHSHGEVILDALALIRSRMGDGVRLRLVGFPHEGSTSAEMWLNRARERGLENAIDLGAPVSAADFSAQLSAASIVLLCHADGPSSRRTTLAAALTHGCTIVAIDGTNTWSLLRTSGAVTLTRAEDSAISQAVCELLGDPGERQRRAGLAGELARTHLDPEAHAREIARHLMAAANGRGCSR